MASNQNLINYTLAYTPVNVKGGTLSISIPNGELDNNISYQKNSLVGNFIGARPAFLVLKQKAHQLWNIKGGLDIHSLPSRFFLFRFDNDEDKLSVLEHGPWFCYHILILKTWTPSITLERMDFSALPIWVRIYNCLFIGGCLALLDKFLMRLVNHYIQIKLKL